MQPPPGSEPTRPSSAAPTLRRARERLLSHDGAGTGGLSALRQEIHASWLRSRHLHVDADHLDPDYVGQASQDTVLTQAAGPVLEHLRRELAGEPIGILLTDAHGTVLQRHCEDDGLTRHLDEALLAPGFVYAESSVGTNGIGTAIEIRNPTMVIGEEHYAETLTRFACAAAPIHHPITGAFLGVVDLTATAPHANPLLLTFAKSASRRVHDAMLASSSAPELALMRDYLAACHHTGGAVLAQSGDVVMMNAQTQRSFDAADQTALLAKLADVTGRSDPCTLLADLPSGATVRLDYRPAFASTGFAGGVFRVQAPTSAARRSASSRPFSPALPGVVGSGATWLRACRAVRDSQRRGEWLVLEGEPGVGKLTLLQGAHQAAHPESHLRVLDETDAAHPESWVEAVAEELASDGGTLVLRHVDLLAPELVDDLASLLLEHSAVDAGAGPWVAVTMSDSRRSPQVAAQLLPHFPHTVTVPPLRHHQEDLARLVPHLLGRIARGQELTMSPGALNHLNKLAWPGNVEQLRLVLARTARARRSGTIVLDDLPPECRAVTRRQLSALESLERDAVVAALVSHDGSKIRAAEALGLSRATIYRKIKDYGITLD